MRERSLFLSACVQACAVFFLFFLPTGVRALDIGLGGKIIRSVTAAELKSLARPLVLAVPRGQDAAQPEQRTAQPEQRTASASALLSPAPEKTVALGEICPLMAEVWRLEASSATGKKAWESDDLGERLFEVHLAEAKGGWDLVVGTERFRAVERVDLSGELLSEKSLEAWVSWEGVPELKEEVARFASSHGLSVRVTDVPNTQTKLLAVARAGGTLPDVVMIQSDYAPALAAARVIQSVEYLRTDDLVPKGFEAFRHEGRFWAVPFYFDAQLVFYNKKLTGGTVRDDWTTDDLERMAAKIAASSAADGSGLKAPMAWNLYSAYWLLPFMAGFGKPSILNPDGSITVDDEPTARALAYLLDLDKRGLLEPAERDAMISWFASGKTAFILSGSYSIPEFTKIGIDFGVAPYPVLSATGKALAPLLDFKGLAIGRRTTKPVLARRLVQYMTSPGVQASFTSKLFKLPASRMAMETARSDNKYYAQLMRSYETGLVVPPAESYAAFKNVMWKLLRFLLTGQMDVATTQKTAAKLIAENLK